MAPPIEQFHSEQHPTMRARVAAPPAASQSGLMSTATCYKCAHFLCIGAETRNEGRKTVNKCVFIEGFEQNTLVNLERKQMGQMVRIGRMGREGVLVMREISNPEDEVDENVDMLWKSVTSVTMLMVNNLTSNKSVTNR